MNIFYLHHHPKICAIYHNDKHVVKMILETVQILYTCLHMTSPDLLKNSPFNKAGTRRGYKMTHKNHPSCIWVRQSIHNYQWLCRLGKELCKEYTFRYKKIHACQKHIKWLIIQKPNLPFTIFTSPTQAMPEKYKNKNTVKAYRDYYIYEKKSFSQWTNRNPPHWFKNDE